MRRGKGKADIDEDMQTQRNDKRIYIGMIPRVFFPIYDVVCVINPHAIICGLRGYASSYIPVRPV